MKKKKKKNNTWKRILISRINFPDGFFIGSASKSWIRPRFPPTDNNYSNRLYAGGSPVRDTVSPRCFTRVRAFSLVFSS